MNGKKNPIGNTALCAAATTEAMTDEELAEWIISITEDLTTRWLDWLKKEVK